MNLQTLKTNEQSRAEIAQHTADFLERGGEITKLAYLSPYDRKPKPRRHLGIKPYKNSRMQVVPHEKQKRSKKGRPFT